MKIYAGDQEPLSEAPVATTANTITITKQPPPPPPLLLPLDVGWYRIVWTFVLLLHVICALYLVGTGMLYQYIDHPYLTYYANLLAPAPDRHFGIMAAAMIVVGCGHVVCLIEMLVVSVINRQLTMTWTSDDPLSKTKSYTPAMMAAAAAARISSRFTSAHQLQRLTNNSSDAPSGPEASCLKSALNRGRSFVTDSIYKPVFSRHGLLGVESVHFDLVFAAGKLVELAFQTLQAYRISQMITRPWINALFVALVVANCWTTPFWQHFLKHTQAQCRLLCIASDIVLNMCTNMAIPWIIFSSYLHAYDREEYLFDAALVYDDVWFTNFVMENRLLFAVSIIDFLSKLIPHATILSCLINSKSLLVRSASRYAICGAKPQSVVAKPVPPAVRKVDWKLRTIHVVFLLWGAALLGIHFRSIRVSDADSTVPGCKQFIRPWFVTGNACATYEHNCHRTPPQELTLSDALQMIHSGTLLSLVVSHCPELVVPPSLQRFPNLLCLEFFNVTLHEWPSEAALSPVFHPSLVTLLLIHTNMTEFPEGILGPLPETLTDIEFVYTNLTKLPDDLHERWNPMAVLYIEYSELHEFPKTLTQLAVNDLSLIGNHIESVEQLSEIPFGFFFLALSYNPIRALPATIDNGATFGFLGLEETLVTTLPSWLSEASAVVEEAAYLHGAPMCLEGKETDAAAAQTVAAASTRRRVVMCDEPNPMAEGRYPLAVMAPRREP